MTSNRSATVRRLALLVWFCGFQLCLASAEDKLDARQLIQFVNDVSDLSRIGGYEVSAVVVIGPGTHQEKRGQISIYRDKDRFRSELVLEQYHQVRLILGNKLYIWRSSLADLGPLARVNLFDRSWQLKSHSILNGKFGKVSAKKISGKDAYCFDTKGDSISHTRFCVDAVQRFLLFRDSDFEKTEYSNYSSIEERQFPGEITVRSQGKVVLAFTDIQVRKAEFSAASFAVPSRSMELETCDDVAPPKAIDVSLPTSWRGRGGQISVFGIVEKDGSFRDAKIVLRDPDSSTEKAFLDAARKWRYSPAMCGSTPVAYEMHTMFGMSSAIVTTVFPRPVR